MNKPSHILSFLCFSVLLTTTPLLLAQTKIKSVNALKIELEGEDARILSQAFGVSNDKTKNIVIDANGKNDFSIRAMLQSFDTPRGTQEYYSATIWINTDVFRPITKDSPSLPASTKLYSIQLVAGTAKTIFDKLVVPEKETENHYVKSITIKDQIQLRCYETKNLINPHCFLDLIIP